jgi:hypothetical protein
MKPLRANSPFLLCLVALAFFSGCNKKKPVVPPPQVQAPSATASPTPAPQETQQAQEPQTPAQGTPPPDPGQPQPATEKGDTSTAKSTKPSTATTKKPAPQPGTTTARNNPPRVVVKPGAAEPSSTPGQISPNPAGSDVSHDQSTTEQLLQSAESNLNNIKRQLSQDEQAIVTQIRDYVNQSRQATKESDLTRAHTLALKAHLLSDELAKRR